MNNNPEISGILKEISEFVKLAGKEQSDFIKARAAGLLELAQMYLNGKISDKDFKRLLKSHKRLIRQNLNTLEIEARSKAEKIFVSILEIIKNRIIPDL